MTDGDTVELSGGRSLRVVGVNTPELGRDGRPHQPLAEGAADFTRRFVAQDDGRVRVRLAEDPEDDHDRLLAHVAVGDQDLATALLEAGLAWAVAIPPNTGAAPCLFQAEHRARAAGRGLWARDDTIRAASGIGADERGFMLVRGRITAAASAPKGALTWLLDDAFRLEIPPTAVRAHPAFGSLGVGDMVEVRGWVFPNAGKPAIRTRHPLNIQ